MKIEETFRPVIDTAILMINENIEKHTDSDGKPFEPYSQGYYFQKYLAKKFKKKNKTAKKKKTIDNFLAKAAAEFQANKNKVDLTRTGTMLASLSAINVENRNNEIELNIGFKSKEAAEIAYYHNVQGAGRGRVIRKFLGITPRQEKELADKAEDVISRNPKLIAEFLRQAGFTI